MDNPPKSNSFHILALSGGGYKGLYTAEIINQIERYDGGCPFGAHFDLICGTSVGGILALALATRDISAAKIVATLESAGPHIFPPISPKRWDFVGKWMQEKTGFSLKRGITSSKHSNAALKHALVSLFGDRRIRDLRTRVLVPSANWTKGGPQFFKTPHKDGYETDPQRSLVDVAMATSAAPIYLPNYEFENKIYVDGGIVGNAPGIFGVHEARHSIEEAQGADISLLAIGTLSSKITADQRKPLNKGLLDWGGDIFEFMLACQEQVAGDMLRQQMSRDYYMIDREVSKEQSCVIGLDKADSAATKTLLGLASQTYQEEIGKPAIKRYLEHQAPKLSFA